MLREEESKQYLHRIAEMKKEPGTMIMIIMFLSCEKGKKGKKIPSFLARPGLGRYLRQPSFFLDTEEENGKLGQKTFGRGKERGRSEETDKENVTRYSVREG